MGEVLLTKSINEAIPLVILIFMGIGLYHGFKKNQAFLSEREELLKRYLLFRGDQQVRLKIYGDDEKLYREILRGFSNSWKNFRSSYDRYLQYVAENTRKTRRVLQLLTLGLIVNSMRLLLEEYFFFGIMGRFTYIILRELSNYILVIFGFFLLRVQTRRYISLKGEALKMEREILSLPNQLSNKGEKGFIDNEFIPIEEKVTGKIGAENEGN